MQADTGADKPALINPLRTRVSGVAQAETSAHPAMVNVMDLHIFKISVAPAHLRFGFGDSAP